mmetsp:Transcript_13775/g.25826  ORF Transcript_13775/g.25826 Transcript_13775/m.25826 type:complete len:180 (+) Transcript_13775:75-614(+)
MLAVPGGSQDSRALARVSPSHRSAFGQYSMLDREVQFGRVPVVEQNTGVIVTHQHIGPPAEIGVEIVRRDDLIRNLEWRHLVGLPLPKDMMETPQLGIAQGHGYFSQKGHGLPAGRHQPEERATRPNLSLPKHLSDRARLLRTGNMVAHVLASECLDERGVREFFSRPEAVSQEETRSV